MGSEGCGMEMRKWNGKEFLLKTDKLKQTESQEAIKGFIYKQKSENTDKNI